MGWGEQSERPRSIFDERTGFPLIEKMTGV
jgi:hypothetical protein